MGIAVCHVTDRATRDQRADAMFGFTEGHAQLCADMLVQGLYDMVAVLPQGVSLDAAYGATNSVTEAWTSPQALARTGTLVLPAYAQGCRSTSVGDVLFNSADRTWHVVSSFGFTDVTAQVRALSVARGNITWSGDLLEQVNQLRERAA